MSERTKILFVFSRKASFIQIDRDLLAESHDLEDSYQPGRFGNPAKALTAVRRNDVVFGWFASWHTFWPITWAWVLRRPSVLIIGGFDTAAMPEIGYGLQQGGIRRVLARWVIKRAGVLVTNSHASQREIERNVGLPPEGVLVVHHGVPDPFGELPADKDMRLAITVGNVDEANLERKGLRPFAEASRELPDVQFVIAGRGFGDAPDRLAEAGGENLRLTGWIEDDELLDLYRRAAVYVQPSLHEGFGLSVAEAMLAGAVPVVSDAGALPEVVGDTGVVIGKPLPAAVAQGIREAHALGSGAGGRARDRVLSKFPLSMRRDGLYAAVARALADRD